MYLKKYDLTGRTAVVTGGGRNIGLAFAQALAEAGATVVLAEVDPALGAEGKATLAKLGLAAEVEEMDVTDSKQVNAVADRVAERHGSIDILVNNAGIGRSGVGAENVEDEHWLNVLDVNLNGTFWCCRAFGRHMLNHGSGAIVNVGSMSGFIVNKPQPQSFYNASKAGVHHLTKSLAAEWADRGVRVNAVAPTYIETDLTRVGMQDERMYPVWLDSTPMRRVGQPDEIGSVVLFLASDASSLMTGSIVLADAGYACWWEMDLVIFDMDGVLVDSEIIAARVATRALNAAGYETDEAGVLDRFLGISNVSMLKIVERDTGIRLTDAFLADLRRDLLAAYEGELQAIPGIEGALGSMTAQRCVASSSNPERIQRSLELTGLAGHFGTDIYSATMVENGKPAPDLFLYAAAQMGADPERCVVIEDSEAGVTGAKAAGMTVLGFTGGSHVRHDVHGPKLTVAGADRVFADMRALQGLIAETAA